MIACASTTLLCALAAFVAVPAASAQAPAASAQAPAGGGVAAPAMAPPEPLAAAAAGNLSVSARPAQMLGQVGRFRGRAPAGRLVRLLRQDPKTLGWTRVAHARADASGAYILRWRPNHIGPTTLRAELGGAGAVLRVTVYKPALATWYGPGFFGRATACGSPLTPDLVGVAHRTLPCGTRVAITYAGRSLVLPVIDRGPYGVPGAEWDLTQAAALTLGITETTRIGAVRLRG